MREKGLFLVFEGIDGAGKSSQLLRTKAYLEQRGFDVVTTREPGGTAISEKIRDLLLDPENSAMNDRCELLLYGASRAQHVAEVIAPALNEGKAVLCDRFSLSTAAYQGYGRGLDLSLLEMVNRVAVSSIEPDRTILVDVSEETGAKRVSVSRGKPKDRLEQEKMDFFRRVRRGFLAEAEKDPHIIVVDGEQPEEEVFAAVLHALEPLL
ncbi:MAG: dTMP kinase [Clostridia bacterium]